MSARNRILSRVRDALASRTTVPHPGPFLGWRPARPEPEPGPMSRTPSDQESPAEAAGEVTIATFVRVFQGAGGTVIQLVDQRAAGVWIRQFGQSFQSAALGETVPAALDPDLPATTPDQADLGISMAWGGIAETGSLVLGAGDGRHVQLLPPCHVIFVRRMDILPTLRAALAALKPALPSAVGLHSGPSKSADIGQVVVRGVHGPGRIIAVIIGALPVPDES